MHKFRKTDIQVPGFSGKISIKLFTFASINVKFYAADPRGLGILKVYGCFKDISPEDGNFAVWFCPNLLGKEVKA
jgi:hypothetical protein